MKENKNKDLKVGSSYLAPTIYAIDIQLHNVLCLSGEPTEQYEEGENYGENW